MAGLESSNLTADWSRCIHINDVIDDRYVASLLPEIMRLRQESDAPITVGINSPGGLVSSLETLLGLLTGPDQSGTSRKIVTVSVDKAHSAAASLLTMGSYAVALPTAKYCFTIFDTVVCKT